MIINIYIYLYIYKVKLTFELLIVRGQQHSFSTHERMLLWKCQSFWDRKCLDLRGTRAPNLRIHAECSNHLSYQGHTFAVPCFEHCLWRYRNFWRRLIFAHLHIVHCSIGILHNLGSRIRPVLNLKSRYRYMGRSHRRICLRMLMILLCQHWK